MKVTVIIPTLMRDSLHFTVSSLSKQTYKPDEIIIEVDKNDKNLARIRNRAIKKATGDIIAFIDDDCMAMEAWLENAINKFENDKELMAIGGKVVGHIQTGEHMQFVGCNTFYRREVFKEIEFDEYIGCYRDETDVLWQMLDKGMKVELYDEIVVNHIYEAGQKKSYVTEAYLQKKHPKRFELLDTQNKVM